MDNLQKEFQQCKSLYEKAEYWESSNALKALIPKLNNLPKSEDRDILQREAKKLLRISNQKRAETFQRAEHSQMISNEEIEAYIAPFLEASKSLPKLIGFLFANYRIEKKEVEKSVQNISPLLRMAAVETTSEDGDIVRGSQNNVTHIWNQSYRIFQETNKTFLSLVLEKLIDENLISAKGLINFLREKNIFSEDFLLSLEEGIQHFFNSEYVAAMHILIPKFEAYFMDISCDQNHNLDIIAFRTEKKEPGQNDVTVHSETKVLRKEFLDDERVIEIWGEDFCEQVKFVFLEPMGYNLRNIAAHGRLGMGLCNKNMASLVLWFYIAIAAKVCPSEEPKK